MKFSIPIRKKIIPGAIIPGAILTPEQDAALAAIDNFESDYLLDFDTLGALRSFVTVEIDKSIEIDTFGAEDRTVRFGDYDPNKQVVRLYMDAIGTDVNLAVAVYVHQMYHALFHRLGGGNLSMGLHYVEDPVVEFSTLVFLKDFEDNASLSLPGLFESYHRRVNDCQRSEDTRHIGLGAYLYDNVDCDLTGMYLDARRYIDCFTPSFDSYVSFLNGAEPDYEEAMISLKTLCRSNFAWHRYNRLFWAVDHGVLYLYPNVGRDYSSWFDVEERFHPALCDDDFEYITNLDEVDKVCLCKPSGPVFDLERCITSMLHCALDDHASLFAQKTFVAEDGWDVRVENDLVFHNDVLIYCLKESQHVAVPEGTTAIADGVFRGLEGLCSVSLPKSLTSIGDSAFKGCTGLQEVTIPECVTEIAVSAFDGCMALTKFSIDPRNSHFMLVDGGIVSIAGRNTLVSVVPALCRGCFTVPSCVSEIGRIAFRGVGHLHVTIPDSVTKIWSSALIGLASVSIRNAFPHTIRVVEDGYDRDSIRLELHVPEGTEEDYRDHKFFGRFVSIEDDIVVVDPSVARTDFTVSVPDADAEKFKDMAKLMGWSVRRPKN